MPQDPKESPWGPTALKVADTGQGADSADLDLAAYTGDRNTRTGKYLLEGVDLFNLMCITGNSRSATVPEGVYPDALAYCVERRAFLVVDAPVEWTHDQVVSTPAALVTSLDIAGVEARNAAVFYPRVSQPDPARKGQVDVFPASGAIAGAMARTDGQRGVWKAAVGIDVSLNGLVGLADDLTDRENGVLNPVAINCLRTFPSTAGSYGEPAPCGEPTRWPTSTSTCPCGASPSSWKRASTGASSGSCSSRTTSPCGPIRLNVGAFMQSLFRQGAFQGTTPREAYFVKCDKETTNQDDINKGIVNIIVGFAPLKPAEFVIVKLQQMAGQIDV